MSGAHTDTNSFQHPYRTIPIPKNAPIKLGPSSGKGWGVFATTRIPKNTQILHESPLFTIPKPPEAITEADVRTAYHHLPPFQKQQFQCIRDNAGSPFTYMSDALAENSFAISLKANEPLVHGCFVLLSRFNHSCVPNAKVPETKDGEETAIFASRDIEVGEEITFCYNTDFGCRTARERHAALRFVCECRACKPGTLFQRLSDMRRRLIRGLQYLTLGRDVEGGEQGSAKTIIADGELRNEAETFGILLSARFVYDLLVMVLLEEEGLLDDFLRGRMEPGILRIAGWFGTEGNVRVVKLAMAQESWLGRFCVAWRLFGRRDEADGAVAELLRLLRGTL